MKEIMQMRDEIDEIDRDIATLLNRRMEVVRRIMAIKKSSNLPVEDSAREQEILMNIDPEKLHESFFRDIYSVIFRYSKSISG